MTPQRSASTTVLRSRRVDSTTILVGIFASRIRRTISSVNRSGRFKSSTAISGRILDHQAQCHDAFRTLADDAETGLRLT